MATLPLIRFLSLLGDKNAFPANGNGEGLYGLAGDAILITHLLREQYPDIVTIPSESLKNLGHSLTLQAGTSGLWHTPAKPILVVLPPSVGRKEATDLAGWLEHLKPSLPLFLIGALPQAALFKTLIPKGQAHSLYPPMENQMYATAQALCRFLNLPTDTTPWAQICDECCGDMLGIYNLLKHIQKTDTPWEKIGVLATLSSPYALIEALAQGKKTLFCQRLQTFKGDFIGGTTYFVQQLISLYTQWEKERGSPLPSNCSGKSMDPALQKKLFQQCQIPFPAQPRLTHGLKHIGPHACFQYLENLILWEWEIRQYPGRRYGIGTAIFDLLTDGLT